MPHGKGEGAETNTPARYLVGSAEKIRPAVAEMRRAIRQKTESVFYVRDGRFAAVPFFNTLCHKNTIFGLSGKQFPPAGYGGTDMKNTIFRGAATAIVTPFSDGAVDYAAFADMIEWQIAEGIDAIVVAGTTGEGSTLTDDEHKEVLRFATEQIAHRVPVIAGTGSNDTAYAIELTEYACGIGADAMLLVTPYYNKATQNGLIASFRAIADASTKPCILYNVPGRTGCNLLPASAAVLADHEKIVAIKEASGNISQIAELFALCGDRMDMYSGNDDQIVPVLSLGGAGVISVLSHVLPKETAALCRDWFEGRVKDAAAAQLRYLPLIDALFSEVNPIPVKAACAAMGLCKNELRLPLTPMEAEHEAHLLAEMKKAGIRLA